MGTDILQNMYNAAYTLGFGANNSLDAYYGRWGSLILKLEISPFGYSTLKILKNMLKHVLSNFNEATIIISVS